MKLSIASTAAAALLLAPGAFAQGVPVDLSNWQTIQYELNSQPDASWDLQPGNTSVLQSVNSDASIFLSDFDAVGQEITGTWSVQTTSDDDFMGFVFGYQDRGHYYLFDWKQTSQNFSGDFAEVGMSLKVVDMPPNTDPTQDDLWPTNGSANVTLLQHNTIPWADNTSYEFTLTFNPGTIEITVREAGQVLDSWLVNDSTYVDGEFGFYNYSQGQVLYQGFNRVGAPEIHCVGKTNSQGCLPALSFTGFASMTDTTPFVISADNLVNRRFSTLMLSLAGRNNAPFQGGTLCIGAPFTNAPVQLTGGTPMGLDCSGTYTLDFNDYLQTVAPTGFVAGAVVNGQVFFRDPDNADGTGYGLTDAIEFTILP